MAPSPSQETVLRTHSVLGRKRPRDSDGLASAQAAPAPRRAKSLDARAFAASGALPGLALASTGKKATASTATTTSGTALISGTPASKGKDKEVVEADERWKKGMFGSFVRKALVDIDNGDVSTYNDLLTQIRPSTSQPLKSSTLIPFLTALTAHASLLSSTSHRSLIEALIALPWTTADDQLVRVYTHMLGVIVSLRMEWLEEVVKTCVRGLGYQSSLRPLFSTSPANLTRGVIYSRYHALLAHLLSLIPTLPSILQPVVLAKFPPKREAEIAHVTYLRNVLRLIEYCPAVADRVLGAVIERAITMDVEIQIEWDDLEDSDDDGSDLGFGGEEDDEDDPDPFDRPLSDEPEEPDLEDDDDASALDDSSEEDDPLDEVDVFSDLDEDETARMMRHRDIRNSMRKLDVILFALFEHFSRMNRVLDQPTPLPPPSVSSSPTSSHKQSRTSSTYGGDFPFPLTASAALNGISTPSSSSSSTTSPYISSTPLSTSSGTSSGTMSPLTAFELEAARQRRHAQFTSLLAIFDRVVLRTFKSRYTQFLLFWFSSLDPLFTDEFQGLLLDKALFSRDTPDVTRIAAASYIASYVSRATWVDQQSVRTVVTLLCRYLERQMEIARSRPEILAGVGGIRGQGGFGVFFAVAQAVFLIFCFRWKDLIDEEDGIDGVMDGDLEGTAGRRGWVPGLDVLEQVVSSPFNPLKVCSPEVVKQFARVAKDTSFLYLYHIIEQNNRSAASLAPLPAASLPSTTSFTVSNQAAFPRGSLPVPNAHVKPALTTTGSAENPSGNRGSASSSNGTTTPSGLSLGPGGQPKNDEADLDSFFPFDPYQLPKSARYINNIYRTWGDTGNPMSGDDSDEDSDFEDDDEAGVPRSTSHPPSSSPHFGSYGGRKITSRSMRSRKAPREDEEMDLLGRSLEGGMSLSPTGGLASRMSGMTGLVEVLKRADEEDEEEGDDDDVNTAARGVRWR